MARTNERAAVTDQVLDVGRLRLLREVAIRGSIAGAARSLGLTASAVSQQLAVLEREAGTALLDRSSRGVELTGAGHALSDRAAAITELLHEARADLDRLRGDIVGEVRLATVASAAATIVSDAATTLRKNHPGIEIRVQTAEPGRSLQLLLAGDVDIALIDEYDYQPVAMPDYLVAVELATEPLVLLSPPGTFGRDRKVHLHQLAEADWVMPPDDAACGFAVRAACRAADFEPRVRWETDDMLLLTRAVSVGHGLAILPRLSVDTNQDVDISVLASPHLSRRLMAVARSAGARRPVVQEVVAALGALSGDR
jgi:DNA-binding transcriptional LysR family regulator